MGNVLIPLAVVAVIVTIVVIFKDRIAKLFKPDVTAEPTVAADPTVAEPDVTVDADPTVDAEPDVTTPACTTSTVLTADELLSLAKEFHDSKGKAIMTPKPLPFVEVNNPDEMVVHIRFSFVSVNGGESGDDARIFIYKFDFVTCTWKVVGMGGVGSGTLANTLLMRRR